MMSDRRRASRSGGPHALGALLPGWQERFNARVADVRAREHERRTAFIAAGGVCWPCRDTGYVNGWQEEDGVPCALCATGQALATRLRATLATQILARSGLERRLAHMTFETFPAPRRKSAGDVRRFAETWDRTSGQGLFLQGVPSVGKTGLLIATLHRVVERWVDAIPTQELSVATLPLLAARQQVWFTTDAALLKRLRAGFADESFHGLVDHAKHVALLVIDDLGKADYKGGVGWGVEQLYDIIDARYSAMLPTWFTTNMGLEQLSERLGENGEAIMDRILDACEAITITGAKLRMGATA